MKLRDNFFHPLSTPILPSLTTCCFCALYSGDEHPGDLICCYGGRNVEMLMLLGCLPSREVHFDSFLFSRIYPKKFKIKKFKKLGSKLDLDFVFFFVW